MENNRFYFGKFYFLLSILFVVGWLGCENPKSSSKNFTISFKEVTEETGLGSFNHETGTVGDKWFPEAMGAGGGFIDYDGDGWQDILLVGGGKLTPEDKKVPALWLYRNNGNETFSLKTQEAGLENIFAYGFGIVVADYDNDDDEDFYLTTLGENLLFRNEGGVFTEVGKKAGVAGPPEWSTSAIFFDADRDGWLDLYVGNYVEWSPESDLWCTLDGVTKNYCTPELYTGIPSRYYQNNGDGTFTDKTESAGFLPAPGKTLGVTEFDFNQDGWPDLVVANDTQRDLLYENNKNGTFTEKGVLYGIAYDENGRARAGMGIDAGVVDNTGEETIFVGNFSKEMIGVYRHKGKGLFEDRAAISKIGRPSLMTLTFGLFLFDADLDGYLDLFAANGHVQQGIELTQDGISYSQMPHLFMNKRDGTFEDVAKISSAGFSQPIVARGAAYADFNRDGKLDILVTENGGPVHLWENNYTGVNHFLRVHLEGRKSNRDGIGSQLIVWSNNHKMQRRIRTGSSFLSNLEKTATFGVGQSTLVDSLHVYWTSGLIEYFSKVTTDQEIKIIEGSGTFIKISMFNEDTSDFAVQ